MELLFRSATRHNTSCSDNKYNTSWLLKKNPIVRSASAASAAAAAAAAAADDDDDGSP